MHHRRRDARMRLWPSLYPGTFCASGISLLRSPVARTPLANRTTNQTPTANRALDRCQPIASTRGTTHPGEIPDNVLLLARCLTSHATDPSVQPSHPSMQPRRKFADTSRSWDASVQDKKDLGTCLDRQPAGNDCDLSHALFPFLSAVFHDSPATMRVRHE